MNSQMRKTANSPRRLREQTVREVTEIDGNANGPEQGSDSESAEATEFELTEEWTDIFRNSNRRSDKRQGGVRKKRRVSFGEENAPEEEQPQLDFGGLAERGRSTKARSLYGEGADDVLAMETALEADFADAVTKHSAEFWPVVPLKQGERPKLL